MTTLSIDEKVLDQLQKKDSDSLRNVPVHSYLGRESFKGEKFDPKIYMGESRAYRSEKSYESSVSVLNRMSKQSAKLEDYVGKFKDEHGAKYSGDFVSVAKQYLSSDAGDLYGFLRGKGRDFYEITKIGVGDIKGGIAGLAMQGSEAALIGSRDFDNKVSEFAKSYGVARERAVQYIMAHEFVHSSQKGRGYDDHIQAELDVEHTLKEYFTAKGDKDLAYIASHRADNVTRNYASVGTYRMPSLN